ncbi:MAG: hypothetical protein Q8K32_09840 [Archangium sp.]|nr:hypothetical protein [Archangium sp.]
MKWFVPLLLLAGCAGPLGALRVATPLTIGDQAFTLRSTDKASADTHRIQSAIAKATPGLQRWGGLKEPVTVYIVDSHDDLETAVRRHGFTWLRAWGRYDDVIFQAPSTWTTKDEFVEQLVLHELTHCLLFQRSGTRDTWYLKDIPLWFREGMAISTAGQAKLYPSLEDSARWLQQNPTLNAFRNGEELSEAQSTEVYGLGLHAFEFLLRRYGEAHVNALMSTMRAGGDFDAAFEKVVGIPVERFQKDFENYLRLRAFRGGSRRRLNAPPREGGPLRYQGTE